MSDKVVNLSVIQTKKDQEEAENLQEWFGYVQQRLDEIKNGLTDGSLRGLITVGIPPDETAPRIDLFADESLPLPLLIGYIEAAKIDIIAFHMEYDDE